MSLTKQLTRIKDEVTEATVNKTRAEGALEQSLKRLKDEFGCKTIDAAKKLVHKYETQSEKAEAEFEEKTEVLEEKYGQL